MLEPWKTAPVISSLPGCHVKALHIVAADLLSLHDNTGILWSLTGKTGCEKIWAARPDDWRYLAGLNAYLSHEHRRINGSPPQCIDELSVNCFKSILPTIIGASHGSLAYWSYRARSEVEF